MSKAIDLKTGTRWQEIRATSSDWNRLDPQELVRMHYYMHLSRAFEETVLDLHGAGLIHGPAHVSIGQEAGGVGAVSALRATDQISGSHRGHHQFLVKALRYVDQDPADPVADDTPDAVRGVLRRSLAEIMGLAEGYCGGRGGSMHLRWTEAEALGTNGILAGGVPIATGVAWARKRRGTGDVSFVFYGDGASNIGAVAESMNLSAIWNLPICFFIDNNGYAVSTRLSESSRETRLSARAQGYGIPAFRVDGMDPVAVRVATEKAVAIMRAGEGPVVIEADLYRYFHHGGGIPGSNFGYRSKEEEAEWRARDPIAFMAKELVGRKLLPPDGNDVLRDRAVKTMAAITAELTETEGNERKVVASLWPDSGFCDVGLRGDLSEFAGARFAEIEDYGDAVTDSKMIVAMADVMNRRMETDERIVCLGEDINRLRGGINGATRGLAARFPDRILGTPLSEQGFTGLAGGIAMEGTYRPVVEIMYADFNLITADQLFNQIAKARFMFGGRDPVPLVLRTKMAVGYGYGPQHSLDPAGLFAMWPGWRIVAPSTPFDYVGLMNSALLCQDPVLVIEHEALHPTNGPVPADDLDYLIPLGKAKVVRPGSAFTVLTYLAMVSEAQDAAEAMGLDAEVIDLRSLDRAGIDWETIGESIRKTNNVVVLEQGTLTASYGAMLTDEIQRRFFDYLDQPVRRIHGGEASPSVSKVLERAALVQGETVRKGFAEMMADQGRPL